MSLFILATLGVATAVFAQEPRRLDEQYREVAAKLIAAALVDEGGWGKLSHLTTRIGNRLSGSPQLEQGVRWAVDRMKAEGLDNAWLQPVKVPHWVRGRESARVVEPGDRPLEMLGLGGSTATPAEGITAPVVVVGSFDELDALGRNKVKDRIVLYDVPWQGYPRTVQYRRDGPSRAARLGAVAVLVRSVTDAGVNVPHTGELSYDPTVKEIPAAAITVEDATWIRRTTAAGQQVQVRLHMEARMLPDADSANVIGEILGNERSDEIVVLGGHLDSWDVGQGAHDDGAGVMAAWHAVTLMKQLGLRPRRTVRVVLWTNEENGGRGGEEYRRVLGNDVKKHIAAIEMDGGAERPIGFGFSILTTQPNAPVFQSGMAKLQQIAKLLAGIEADSVAPGGGGADITPLMRDGVPGLELRTTGEHFYNWHHTEADTLDKINQQDFRRCVAALAVMAYVLADMPGTLGN